LNEKWTATLKNGFDVIVGNPPFNEGGIKSCKGDKTVKGTETIWPDFIENSFKKLLNHLDIWCLLTH
jgi:tRNA1(Val) A37 N6-methylase TrmN6